MLYLGNMSLQQLSWFVLGMHNTVPVNSKSRVGDGGDHRALFLPVKYLAADGILRQG